jgi:hypothetical protein
VICAECLSKLARASAEPKKERRLPLTGVGMLAQIGAGALMTWFCFYLLGRMLLSMPSEFHAESFLWKAQQWMGAAELDE